MPPKELAREFEDFPVRAPRGSSRRRATRFCGGRSSTSSSGGLVAALREAPHTRRDQWQVQHRWLFPDAWCHIQQPERHWTSVCKRFADGLRVQRPGHGCRCRQARLSRNSTPVR